MSTIVPTRRQGSYGIDAPHLLPIPAVLVVANVVQGVVTGTPWPFAAAAVVMACMGCGLYTCLRGKFLVWDELVDRLGLRGDEQVLDLGCGRGAVLLLAARRLTARAVGVDLRRGADQSGNAAEATRRNARAEGVADRVALFTADLDSGVFQRAPSTPGVRAPELLTTRKMARARPLYEWVSR